MVYYNTDKFREFLQTPNSRAIYNITDEEYDAIINDDVERLKFNYHRLKEASRQAEIEAHKEKAPFENYMDD